MNSCSKNKVKKKKNTKSIVKLTEESSGKYLSATMFFELASSGKVGCKATNSWRKDSANISKN
jgi:hypothetical protein